MAEHKHEGVLHDLYSLYGKYWVPFLFWFGEIAFDGRVNAGQASHYSRVVRLAANALALSIIGIFIAENGFDAFMEDGAQMDNASTVLTTCCMAVNMIAVLIGSAANHHKIQQYYDAEISWHLLKNERDKTDTRLPHGLGKDVPWEVRQMQYTRYMHDFNGIAGSLLSLIICSAFIANMWGAGSVIPLFALGALFIASRASALLSVLCVPFTTQYRLNVYKNVVSKKAMDYCNDEAINIELNKIKYFNKALSYGEQLLFASCYRACEIAGKTNASTIEAVISKYYDDNLCFIVSKVKEGSGMPFIDGVNMVEAEVLAALNGRAAYAKPRGVADPKTILLGAQLHSHGAGIQNDKLTPYVIFSRENKSWRIDTAKVCRNFSTDANPHGSDQYILGHHTRKLVNLACQP